MLIVGESWRSSRSSSKRRDAVDDKLEDLQSRVEQLSETASSMQALFDERWAEERQRCAYTCIHWSHGCCNSYDSNDELTQILERVVEIGIKGGLSELEGTPLVTPRIQWASSRSPSQTPPLDSAGSEPSSSSLAEGTVAQSDTRPS